MDRELTFCSFAASTSFAFFGAIDLAEKFVLIIRMMYFIKNTLQHNKSQKLWMKVV